MRIGIAAGASSAETLRRTVGLRCAHQVVWVVASGGEATERCAVEPPDLVLMDLSIAVAEGGRATRGVTAGSRCAVLVVSDGIAGRTSEVFDAMGYGAFDAAEMPSNDPARLAETAAAICVKLELISRLMGARPEGARPWQPRTGALPALPSLVVAIGASAGGPAAIAALLRDIPQGFPGAIVIVQHVDREFVPGMAGWLSERSRHPVAIAREGDQLVAGRVLLAGADGHLALQPGGRLGYCAEPRQMAYQPSVDVFFRSVSERWTGHAIGILLTGMGKDGAAGLKALRDRRHHTIAQDEATSAVYGMPKAAAALEAAIDILPLDRIAARVLGIASRPASPVAG